VAVVVVPVYPQGVRDAHPKIGRGDWLLGLLLVILVPVAAAAQTADNLLVVINDFSPASVEVGEYYAHARTVAVDHIVHVKTVTTDTIARAEYERTIESPIFAWLSQGSLQDTVLYIVLTKGVPLRIAGTGGLEGTVASVDSELTLLYRKLLGVQPPIVGRLPNPYFLGDKPVGEAKPFTRFTADTYLVTRLDGFTVDDVRKLIDRGLAPTRDGKIVLDEKATLMTTLIDRGGDQWLEQTATRLQQAGAGDRVVLETTRAVATASGPVIGYYSWGSNDPANRLRHFGLDFANGALAGMFVSTDGRTFTEPPVGWMPGGGPQSAGFGSQSLAGDLIHDGITGVAAHVAEPFLDATIRPQILFPAYLAGFNLAESFYLAMPYLSWQTVVIGDPLCSPFPRTALTADQLSKGLDPDTDLPALFSERRLALAAHNGLNPQALKLLFKEEAHLTRGDRSDAEALLMRAVELEPRFTVANLRLALMYEENREYDKAIDRYRRVVAIEPQNAAVLNNLAYDLAEHQHTPKDALPLAERAYRLAAIPVVADTLGWIQHLLGDDQAAAPLLERAAAAVPDNPEILVHAAFVHAAVNNLAKARQELDAAEKLDPHLADRADIKTLRERLKSSP
jgi:uncharacterized protein (TIGR03790 family)